MFGWFLSSIEDWLCSRDPTFVASMLPIGTKWIIRQIQLFKLHRTVKYVYEKSEFYRRAFRERGIKPSDIKSISDITKIPFTTPIDIQRNTNAFLAVPRERIVRIFTSAGTTGSPKKIFYTKKDMEHMVELSAIGQAMMGIKKGDTCQITLAYGRPSWGGGVIAEMGGQRLGVTVLASGDTLSVEEQIQVIKELGSTVLCGYPSYLHRVTEEASKNEDLTQLGIRKILIGGMPWPESLRKYLQDKWNAKAYDAYGLTEMSLGVAGECIMQNGLHVNEFDFIVEVVDPSTGEQLEAGEKGELVITTLSREGMPILRYRTHDISYLIEEPCGCGQKTCRIGRISGRADDMFIIGTDNIFPYMFDQAFLNLKEVMDYQIVIEKEGYRDKITMRAEVGQKTEKMRGKILEAFFQISPIGRDIKETQTIAQPKVELLEPGTLKKPTETKVRKIIDKR